MIPQEHSCIRSSRDPSSHSDLQSLHDLRELLPIPRSPSNNPDPLRLPSQTDRSWSSRSDQQAKELMSKIISQAHDILKLREQLYYYKTQFFRISQQYQTSKKDTQQFDQQQLKWQMTIDELHERLKAQTAQKEDFRSLLGRREKDIEELKVERMRLKGKAEPIGQSSENKLNQEMQRQAQIIMELMVKNQKIMKINAFLRQELTIAEGKLVRLEMETQQQTCGLLFQNLERLKENYNSTNNKAEIHLSNWETTDPPRKSTQHLYSYPLEKQVTVKLTSRESKEAGEARFRRESRTVEKDRGVLEGEKQKLMPVEEPKPQRKGHLGEPSRKYQRGASWWGESH